MVKVYVNDGRFAVGDRFYIKDEVFNISEADLILFKNRGYFVNVLGLVKEEPVEEKKEEPLIEEPKEVHPNYTSGEDMSPDLVDKEETEEKENRLKEENEVLKKEGMLHEEYQGEEFDWKSCADKNKLEEFAKNKFGVDLDRRKSLKKMKNEIKELIDNAQ